MNVLPPPKISQDRLARFVQLQGSDPGFFILAIHSFVESWLRDYYKDYRRTVFMNDLLLRFSRDELELEVGKLRGHTADKRAAESRLKVLEEELQKEQAARRQNSARSDEIRRERAALKESVASLEDQISELGSANDYILGLTRMTLYTRSRIDYERELARLTPDQQQILAEITLGGDFLVKGGAGTGKTLVLLEALGKLLKSSPAAGASDRPSFALITYSDTLVKYDRYVASIIKMAEREERILAADAYLARKLAVAAPGAQIDEVRFLELVSGQKSLSFMNSEDAAAELEGFLFANDVSEREYCVDMVSPEQRRAIWELRQKVVGAMEAERRYSRNYSRTKIRAAVMADPTLATEDYLFIDEVQDLAPVDLMALKALTRKAIIMAGDNDQAIFRKVFSFKRAGIDIVGKSRTIKLNFRNTIQINDLAERFRRRPVAEGEEGKKASERPSQAECYDAPFRETMTRNLIYVCMTRAMEQLTVFSLEDPKKPALQDVIAAFREGMV